MRPGPTPQGHTDPLVVRVAAEHHIAQARFEARALAQAIGLRRAAIYHVATSVSELASNLFFHTPRGGTITLSALSRDGEIGLEVVAEDDGPGIPDVQRAMEDGFTTNRGLGGGLPGAQRLMDDFEITSTLGAGTRIVARKWQPCR